MTGILREKDSIGPGSLLPPTARITDTLNGKAVVVEGTKSGILVIHPEVDASSMLPGHADLPLVLDSGLTVDVYVAPEVNPYDEPML